MTAMIGRRPLHHGKLILTVLFHGSNAPLYGGLPIWVFIPLQMVAVAATVMTAYGGRDLYSAGKNEARDVRLMRAGIFLFITAFTATAVLTVVTLLKVRDRRYRNERAATVCALFSVPFMSVRLAYSAGYLFSGHDSVLNPLSQDDTSIWLHFFMVIVMEYAATLSATSIALTAKRVVTVIASKRDELLPLSEEEP